MASIKVLIVAGAFGDAYTLLRRFSEISWLHVSVMLRLHEPSAMDELLADDEVEMTAERLAEIWEKGFYVDEIEAWLADTSPLPKNKKFGAFTSSTAAKAVYALLDRERFCAIGERCNDHVHLNHFATLRLGAGHLSESRKLELLDQFREDFLVLFVRHIALTFSINPPYMGSSDYVDSLECGFQPVEGSQYWVAPFIQELFDSVVTVHSPAITESLKDLTYMELA